MGRAQVKYRATHGRGRGAFRGRGPAASSSSTGGRGRGGRSLGSNAFRYETREEDAEEEEGAELAEEEELATSAATRRQFFASEQRYRAAGGTHFQSRTVRQWEAAAAAADDDGDGVSLGVLDFGWLAEQLGRVPPATRYRMDPKDCVDLALESPTDAAPEEDERALESLLALSATVPSGGGGGGGGGGGEVGRVETAATPAPSSQAQMEAWLDDVLDM